MSQLAGCGPLAPALAAAPSGDCPAGRIALCQTLDRQLSADGITPDDSLSARTVVQAAGLRLWDLRLRTRADAMRLP